MASITVTPVIIHYYVTPEETVVRVRFYDEKGKAQSEIGMTFDPDSVHSKEQVLAEVQKEYPDAVWGGHETGNKLRVDIVPSLAMMSLPPKE